MSGSFSDDLGRGVVGVGIGFALYLFVTGLGLGWGRGEEGARGRGETKAPDEKRLTFVMTQPLAAEPFNPMTFRLRDEDPIASAKTCSNSRLGADGSRGRFALSIT